MKKKLFVLLFVLLILMTVLSVPSFAQSGKAVYDLSEKFTDEQEAHLNALANEFFKGNGCSVYIVTAPTPITNTGARISSMIIRKWKKIP